MKQFMAVAATAAVAQASAQCLYCRRSDKEAGFLVGYSYCPASDECLKDAWNYVTRKCEGGWQAGSKSSLEDCEATETQCPGFNST